MDVIFKLYNALVRLRNEAKGALANTAAAAATGGSPTAAAEKKKKKADKEGGTKGKKGMKQC